MTPRSVSFAWAALAIVAVGVLVGCDKPPTPQWAIDRANRDVQSEELCIKQGGLIIRSRWAGRMVDCKKVEPK